MARAAGSGELDGCLTNSRSPNGFRNPVEKLSRKTTDNPDYLREKTIYRLHSRLCRVTDGGNALSAMEPKSDDDWCGLRSGAHWFSRRRSGRRSGASADNGGCVAPGRAHPDPTAVRRGVWNHRTFRTLRRFSAARRVAR